MSPVGLAVQAPGRDPGIQVCRVRGADLQDVRDVDPQELLYVVVSGNLHVADAPQLVPGAGVAIQGFFESAEPENGLLGVCERLVYGGVAGAIEGDHLLHAHRLLLPDFEAEDLVNVVVHLVDGAFYFYFLAVFVDVGAGGLGDEDTRLAGTGPQPDHVFARRRGRGRREVAAFEFSVAGDAVVGDPAVEGRHDLNLAGPVFRRDPPLYRPLMPVGHADEAAGLDGRLPARPVTEPQIPDKYGVAQVQLVPVVKQLDVIRPDGLLVLDAKL